MKHLIIYFLCIILVVFIIIDNHKVNKLNCETAHKFWQEAYAAGRLNQIYKYRPNYDFDKQYTVDSVYFENRIKKWFK